MALTVLYVTSSLDSGGGADLWKPRVAQTAETTRPTACRNIIIIHVLFITLTRNPPGMV